jgi:hypothetical protein
MRQFRRAMALPCDESSCVTQERLNHPGTFEMHSSPPTIMHPGMKHDRGEERADPRRSGQLL